MLAAQIDPGVLTILRRHSTEGTLCDNVECAADDPTMIESVGSPDEFGFVGQVRCLMCSQVMSTKCYDEATWKKVRVLSASELKSGDHIAWHTAIGTTNSTVQTRLHIKYAAINDPSTGHKYSGDPRFEFHKSVTFWRYILAPHYYKLLTHSSHPFRSSI